MVHVARSTLDLLAAGGDRIHQIVVIGELGAMVHRYAIADALELQLDDLAKHFIAQGGKVY